MGLFSFGLGFSVSEAQVGRPSLVVRSVFLPLCLFVSLSLSFLAPKIVPTRPRHKYLVKVSQTYSILQIDSGGVGLRSRLGSSRSWLIFPNKMVV